MWEAPASVDRPNNAMHVRYASQRRGCRGIRLIKTNFSTGCIGLIAIVRFSPSYPVRSASRYRYCVVAGMAVSGSNH